MNSVAINATHQADRPFFVLKNGAESLGVTSGPLWPPLADVALLLATPDQALAWLAPHATPRSAPDIATALRQRGVGSVLILGHPQATEAALRGHDWMDTPHASGWLSRPDGGPTDAEPLAQAAAQALAQGFVAADALVLARLGPDLNMAHLPRLSLPGHAVPTPPLHPPFPVLEGDRRTLGLYPVVDSAEWVERVLAAGVRTVQLRIKDPARPDLRQHIRRSVAAARAAHAQLYINDHWQMAIEEGAFGVHLGQEDLGTAGMQDGLQAMARAGLHLGLSTHSPWEVARAWGLRPSYIACGPIHATTTKDMPWLPQGNGNLAFWSHLLPVPVVGIAGMDAARLTEAMRHGAAGVALITAITAAPDPEAAIRQLQQSWAAGASAPPVAPPPWPRSTLSNRDTPCSEPC